MVVGHITWRFRILLKTQRSTNNVFIVFGSFLCLFSSSFILNFASWPINYGEMKIGFWSSIYFGVCLISSYQYDCLLRKIVSFNGLDLVPSFFKFKMAACLFSFSDLNKKVIISTVFFIKFSSIFHYITIVII